MKNKLLKCFVFLFSIVSIIYIIQYSFDFCFIKRVNQKFAKMFKHQIDYEIMIFGSSVAYHHFDPNIISNITKFSTYNMGWDGIFFIQYNPLINEYLSYNKKCKYLVIAIDCNNLYIPNLISRPDLYYAYLNNDFVFHSLHQIEPQKIWNARYIPGYKLTLLNKMFYNGILFNSIDDGILGYKPVTSNWNKQDTIKNNIIIYNDSNLINEFKYTIKKILDNNINVILVMTPIFRDGYNKILNYNSIKSIYNSINGKGVYYLDYTIDTMCLNKTYFYNYSHLNKEGATLFSNKFSMDLLNIINKN